MNRLTRSKTDRVLGGVCGGLGEYLGLDPNLVRVFFVLLALGEGAGVMLYLLLWILLPVEQEAVEDLGASAAGAASKIGSRARTFGVEISETATRPSPAIFRWVGVTMVLLGGFFLLRNLDIVWLRWLDLDVLWPALLILAGVAVILRRGEINAA